MPTYPLSLPSVLLSVSIRPRETVAVSQSPFTFSQQVQAGQGDMWEADVTFPIRRHDEREAGAVRAFVVGLRGAFGTFLMGDPLAAAPRLNTTPGSPFVSGGDQAGRSLITGGWSSSDGAYALRAGDYIQLGSGGSSRLHMLTDDALIDGTTTILNIWPKLRYSPANGAPLNVFNPVGLWRMAAGQNPGWTENTLFLDGVSFTAMEAL